MKVSVTIRIPFYPTENEDKIKICVENLLGEIPEFQEKDLGEYKLLEKSDIDIRSIENFFSYIRKAEILDSVRRYSVIDYSENSVVFSFHKQALFVGKMAVIAPDTSSPLGNVELWIRGRDPEKILDWIAPQTEDGREITPSKFNDIFNL